MSFSANSFILRIVSIDYYMSPPNPDIDICYSNFQGGEVNEVPIIRVYGPTPSRQKTCMHIHGALPYLFVLCRDIPLFKGDDTFLHTMSVYMERALSLSNTVSNRQHVHGCSIVRARRFYGYFSREDLFVKIYLYYPHDVSRAASLLLGGSVFDKSIQPHESHIPFMLQFMIDYNLFGMGYLHISKIKFRNPVPDDIPSSLSGHQQGEYSYKGKVTSPTSPDMQGESSHEIHFGSQVWSSSTIPRDWFWQFPNDFFSSSSHTAHPVKRQSKCALEADAMVDDIINQKFKMYSSLSQTGSDVKMVQSLVPIWEEENERTGGIHVKNIPLDPGKPLPADVLKTLSHGLELPDKFIELVGEKRSPVFSGNDVCFLQSLRPSIDDTTTTEKEKSKVDFYDVEDLGCYNVKSSAESVLSQRTLQEMGNAIKLDEKIDLYPYTDTGTPFGSGGSLNPMSTDQEALELLRWLALSQPDEDIHSDGTTSDDAVFEHASKDCENESQQECQDILDSVGDLIDFQKIKEPGSLLVPCKNVVQKSVPQMNGSADNFTSVVDTMKENSQESPFRHSEVLKPCDTVGRKPIWGSLPFSAAQQVDCLEVENSEGTVVGCSVRDLMRKRQSFQTDVTEPKNVKKISVEETHTSDAFSFPKPVNCCMASCTEQETTYVDSDSSKFSFLKQRKGACSNGQFKGASITESSGVVYDIRSAAYRNSVYCKLPLFYDGDGSEPFRETHAFQEISARDNRGGSFREYEKHYDKKLDNFDQNEFLDIIVADSPEYDHGFPKYDSAIGENVSLEHHSTGNKQEGGDSYLSSHCNFASDYKAPVPSELFCMNLCKKPPKIELDDIIRKTEAVTGLLADEVLPFFIHQGEKSNYGGASNTIPEDSGIPRHYQNDGSSLYLLTPALSPPSEDRVYKWLLRGETDPFKDTHADVFKCKPDDEKHAKQAKEIKSSYNTIISSPTGKDMTESKNFSIYGKDISQISASSGKSNPTPLNQMGFRDPARVSGSQQLTLFSVEVQAESTGNMKSNPLLDAINVIAIVIQGDYDSSSEYYVIMRDTTESCTRNVDGISCKVQLVSEERVLLENFVRIIWSFDPDILMGWDVQANSLGYLAERASHLGMNLIDLISRAPSQKKLAARGSKDDSNENLFFDSSVADPVGSEDATIDDEWGRTHASGIHVDGRIVLNIWRLMRSEIKLSMYTAENVAAATLRRKVPLIHNRMLTKWYSSGPSKARHRCVDYVMERAKLNLEIVNQHDLINRTSELARVFGIDFFSVLSRGSQYRVESMLLRLAHTQNYIAISPGKQQVASQPAMECIPLVMEPESGFYFDPVVVLDFQSLYPSIIIAYNLCFCTCLGKIISPLNNQLGVSSFHPDPNALKEFRTKVLFTPNGVMYMPAEVRKGILPRLLEEILSTRLMVKQAMKKLDPSEHIIHRIFNARQLALKLIANVTYGYTAAGFSGRMPCAELADSIVQCGRRTLETAISFVNNCDKWKARVVYGDTDSMFVLLKGRTVKEAFEIGGEIASAITAMNPYPVALKMEKVYSPCVLLTKKRYVGYSYETVDQTEPIFDAKGIETVRRDTCPAVSKIMEKSLRLFFEHRDLSLIRSYLQRQWTKILSGRVSLQDFIFSKEVRLGTYSSRPGSALPPAAIVALKAMSEDPRAEPRYAERVPYVVVHGSPGGRLQDMVVGPSELLVADSPLRLNDLYYITKQIIPALQRVFGLLGADLNHWFSETPRAGQSAGKRRRYLGSAIQKMRIDSYYLSMHCVLCGALVGASLYLCEGCSGRPVSTAAAITGRTAKLEREMHHLCDVCRNCGGGDWVVESGVKCTSLACPVFFERRKLQKELHELSGVAANMGLYPSCLTQLF